jgi:hypothetical protein
MVIWAKECSASLSDCCEVSEIAGQPGQLPAFESEYQAAVRIQPRQQAGEALKAAMVT